MTASSLTADGPGSGASTTVLVTGATGFLGSCLVRRLLGDAIPVRILVRSRQKAAPLVKAGAVEVVGDITDPAAVTAALEGVNTVYHLAGRLFAPGVPASEYWRTHLEGTRVVVAACERRGVRRLVHCSTTGVLGVTGERPAGEDAPTRPTNVYEATKALAETAARDGWGRGLPVAIARPGLVYGPGDLHLLPFFRSVIQRRFRPLDGPPAWLHPVYVEDVVDAFLLCARQPAAVGECFHVAGPEPVTLAGLANEIAAAAGTQPPRGRIPLSAARALALAGDLLPAGLQRSAPLTSNRLDFLTHSRVYQVDKARRLLGFTAATTLQTGIRKTVDWYRGHGHLPARPVPVGP